MVVVAVAGGTGHVGRTIVEMIHENSKHKVIILARKAPEASALLNPVIAVDYSDVDAVAKVLVDNDVHTVISTIHVTSETSSAAERSIIKAAAKSTATKRFVASNWGVEHGPTSMVHMIRQPSIDELRTTDLEWTQFENGYFLDYYGPAELKTHMAPMPFALDIANKTAAIPATGNEAMTLTYSFDLGKFVAAALDLPKWEEKTVCYGDKTTWNEVLRLAEDARGSKFDVTYDPAEKLERGEVTELPAHVNEYQHMPKQFLQGLMAMFGLNIVEGRFDLPVEKSLNKKFPDIKPLTVKEVIEMWKGK